MSSYSMAWEAGWEKMIDVRESTDKLKILIVDDSELNRELLAGMLGDEYEIYQVENGKKAIDILEENREQRTV